MRKLALVLVPALIAVSACAEDDTPVGAPLPEPSPADLDDRVSTQDGLTVVELRQPDEDISNLQPGAYRVRLPETSDWPAECLGEITVRSENERAEEAAPRDFPYTQEEFEKLVRDSPGTPPALEAAMTESEKAVAERCDPYWNVSPEERPDLGEDRSPAPSTTVPD